jgi:hypothetical protein
MRGCRAAQSTGCRRSSSAEALVRQMRCGRRAPSPPSPASGRGSQPLRHNDQRNRHEKPVPRLRHTFCAYGTAVGSLSRFAGEGGEGALRREMRSEPRYSGMISGWLLGNRATTDGSMLRCCATSECGVCASQSESDTSSKWLLRNTSRNTRSVSPVLRM